MTTSNSDGAGPQRKVLLVDDDAMIRRLATSLLTRGAGCAVSAAPSGEEGIALGKAEVFDLILLDVDLPDMNGTAVFDALKAAGVTARTPVVFLTGSPEHLTLPEGARGVLAKPFSPASFAASATAFFEAR